MAHMLPSLRDPSAPCNPCATNVLQELLDSHQQVTPAVLQLHDGHHATTEAQSTHAEWHAADGPLLSIAGPFVSIGFHTA